MVSAFEIARRNARFGHRDWLVWGDQSAPLSEQSLRAAMADGERFALVSAGNAIPSFVCPKQAEIMLRNIAFLTVR